MSRHLGDMGYSYRNVRKDKGRNDPKVKEVRKLYADCVMPVLRRDEVVMFVGETLFALENSVQEEQDKAEEKTMSHRVEECMSVIAIIHENGLMYSALKEGIIGRLDFEEALRDCFGPLSCLNEEVIGSCTAHLFLNMAPLHCHEESLEGNRKYLM